MKYETITYAVAESIATITLDRPEVLNALNPQMRVDILHALRRAESEARVLMLTGTGQGFCAGQDLSGSKPSDQDSERMLREEYNPLIEALTDCRIPTLAGVNGIAAGDGVSLALACDIVVASHNASFAMSFARAALVPDAGSSYHVLRSVGLAKSLGAALLAETISAQQADDWGLIWESVPDDVFKGQLAKRATHLAAGPTETYRLIRETVRGAANRPLSAQLDNEAEAQGHASRTRDYLEGVSALLDKRTATFQGR